MSPLRKGKREATIAQDLPCRALITGVKSSLGSRWTVYQSLWSVTGWAWGDKNPHLMFLVACSPPQTPAGTIDDDNMQGDGNNSAATPVFGRASGTTNTGLSLVISTNDQKTLGLIVGAS